jgi:hypothetical protein
LAMVAVPLGVVSTSVSPASVSFSKRRPLALTQRRLAANRRNAARSTGPRTVQGKARVARNPIKHGFFTGALRWTDQQHRDFTETFDGLCEEFKPRTDREQICVAIIADSYVRMAALLRYENIAALEYHRECERELEERIGAADAAEAARLEAHREKLRRAGLWRPTIPGPREATAILRYEGRLHRAIRAAVAELERKPQKQTHFLPRDQGIFDSIARGMSVVPPRRESTSSGVPVYRGEGPRIPRQLQKVQKQTHFVQQGQGISFDATLMGNRHQRRKAKALARRRA